MSYLISSSSPPPLFFREWIDGFFVYILRDFMQKLAVFWLKKFEAVAEEVFTLYFEMYL